MSYTVNQLATLAHTSVRTLHHYDNLGLLSPSRVGKNGYRYYEEKELIKLQQILFFKELDFPLEEIKRLFDRPGYNVALALRDQKHLLKLKRARLDGLIKTIDSTLLTMTTNQPLKDNDLYDAFKDDDLKHYQAEVKERWGATEAYKQSTAKVAKMTKEEMAKLKADGQAFTKKLAEAMPKGATHPDVQALIEQHHAGIEFFYTCPIPMYRSLGQMYVDDPRFTAYYDKFAPGLAVFVRDAIAHFCDVHEQA